ncbi:anaerobic ribonucleoside-triphosphate reductase activating protein [Clostridium felsineum]|uniref:Anaerobic ribonucleoside-triphosphate reductase-activating protein n=1 Tax=Clostridium felsineum TaxID=36839 RepID=A0A1S8M773_9CLOT|nr:anaerobic ribonucleoside-triphosphate reductase activating protein [Clostridium felsineum]URZ05095.1 Anaerobic ribonucleoside-triphosphate reductase-activating protein [Clostridium felsineum]URZ10136.1 Anaerobic ribonucleoside-triphosphate reductase-activating protein [Clostridium felsineum]
MKLTVAGFLDNSMVNGEGMRSVLFLSGCKRRCKGCQNVAMQDFKYGEEATVEEILNRIKSNMPIIKGVTFSGGDPMEQAEALSKLAKDIKAEGLNIWCYTGYTYEELLEEKNKNKLELLKYIDVLVDGEFKEELMDNSPKYAGSSNQRIIRLK